MNFANMDTPMLRDLYRQIRENVIRMAGGNAGHFNEACALELEYKAMNPTPRNWVVVALDIEREEMNRYMESEEQFNLDNVRDQWEAKMEDKYDFNKEN